MLQDIGIRKFELVEKSQFLYHQARVNGGSNYEYPRYRWVLLVVFL